MQNYSIISNNIRSYNWFNPLCFELDYTDSSALCKVQEFVIHVYTLFMHSLKNSYRKTNPTHAYSRKCEHLFFNPNIKHLITRPIAFPKLRLCQLGPSIFLILTNKRNWMFDWSTSISLSSAWLLVSLIHWISTCHSNELRPGYVGLYSFTWNDQRLIYCAILYRCCTSICIRLNTTYHCQIRSLVTTWLDKLTTPVFFFQTRACRAYDYVSSRSSA